jgi:hypothetical protein
MVDLLELGNVSWATYQVCFVSVCVDAEPAQSHAGKSADGWV